MNGNMNEANDPVVVLPDAPPAARDVAPDVARPNPLLARLLKMADGYRAENALHQAAEIYFELAEKHAGTPEAYDAAERLLEIGDQYERDGEVRQARSMYERLL